MYGDLGFFCQSDFTWNQFWGDWSSNTGVLAILEALDFVNMVNFCLLAIQKFIENQNQEPLKVLKMADYKSIDSPTLISHT